MTSTYGQFHECFSCFHHLFLNSVKLSLLFTLKHNALNMHSTSYRKLQTALHSDPTQEQQNQCNCEWRELLNNKIRQTFRVTGLLDLFHSPEVEKLENTTHRKLYQFSSPGERRKTNVLLCPLQRVNVNHWTNWMRLALFKRTKRVDIFLSSPQDENRPSFRNVVFSNFQNTRQ
jgi:hypothetical protein